MLATRQNIWVFEHSHGYICKTRLFFFSPYGRAAKKDGECTSKRRRTAVASPKERKKTLVEIGDKKKSKADPDEGTDLEENGDEQDLEDEEADEGADVKERMD